jgi:hypothetical protein
VWLHINDSKPPKSKGEVMAASVSFQEFLERSAQIHGTTYDYSKVRYNTASQKVTIVCKKHGPFLQKPSIHLTGSGCTDCAREKKSEQRKRETKPGVLKGDQHA